MFFGEKKKCAGTYLVNGYTREDGTKVSSYTRTCGAKHAGNITGAAANVGDDNKFNLNAAKNEFVIDKKIFDTLLGNIIYPLTPAYLQGSIEKNSNFKSLYHKYYKLSLDFQNQKQYNKDNVYIKFKDIKESNVKDFIKEKCNIDELNDNTDVVIPQYGSPLVKTVSSSPELKNTLKKYLPEIKNGQYKNKSFDVIFDKTKDAHLTIGKSKLFNVRIVDGYIYGTLIDYYDFDKLYYKTENFKTYSHSLLPVSANANAILQQNTGRLMNYLIIFPIKIYIDQL